MKFRFEGKDSDSFHGPSSSGSCTVSLYGDSPDRSSCLSTASRDVGHSSKTSKRLKNCLKGIVDLEQFSNSIGDWVLDRAYSQSHTTDEKHMFRSPFTMDELLKLDYALEGVLFQQIYRMSYSRSADAKESQYLALEDFLHTTVDGLLRTFWDSTTPLPFLVSCPRYPGSKLYSVEKAIANGRLERLTGAAVVVNSKMQSLQAHWSQVLEFMLFRPVIAHGKDAGFPASTICEALLYGFHILFSRRLNKLNMNGSDSVYLLVMDAKFGGIIKFGGNLSKLEINSNNPYKSIGEWIKLHAEVFVSPVERIWNKLGNVNWGDIGSLQFLLATFNSIVKIMGPPKRSIDSLALNHSLRLQKRRLELNGFAGTMHEDLDFQNEIVEVDSAVEHRSNQYSCLKFNPGEVVLVEDLECQKAFQVKEILPGGNCYCASSIDHPAELLSLYVGAHSSQLEPSWEAMDLWYLVQRQSKVLNIMKQQGISSMHLPSITAYGRIPHSGHCRKQNSTERCDHPFCGIPVLVTSPFGKPLTFCIAQSGPLSTDDALRCCRDCLTALCIAARVNILHSDICPENIIRVDDSIGAEPPLYVPVAWGRSVLEDKDSPALNLQFSSSSALQFRKLCPSSDVESLIYLLYFACGGRVKHIDSIESALKWREKCWSKRLIQQLLGEISAPLKAFADYVDGLCGTPYPVDYEFWLNKLNREVNSLEKGKLTERVEVSLKLEDTAESSGTSGGGASMF